MYLQSPKTSFEKSGNAGYISGKPLLFGELDSTFINAIAR